MGGDIAALQSALANVMAQRRAIRALDMRAGTAAETEAGDHTRDGDNCAPETERFEDSERKSPTKTPEAIRTSRRLRQNHETNLARFDARHVRGYAEDEVAQRLQALQQRRRELTRALEHLEVVQTAEPQTEGTRLEKGTCNLEDGGSQCSHAEEDSELNAPTCTDEDVCIDVAQRLPDPGRDGPNELRAESCRTSGSSEFGEDGEEVGIGDALGETGSFDMLVQNLLRVSLADGASFKRETETAKAGEQCQHEAMSMLGQIEPLPLHPAQNTSVGFSFEPAAGPGLAAGKMWYPEWLEQKDEHEQHMKATNQSLSRASLHQPSLNLPSLNPSAGDMSDLKQPCDAEVSLRELLCKGHQVSGLLRPQDLQTFAVAAANGRESEMPRPGENITATLQFQHARLHAAAALERAHIEASAQGAEEEAGDRGACDAWQGQEPLLPPLALSLAASLRHSGASMFGISLSCANEALVAPSENDAFQPLSETWSCVHECLAALKGAMSSLDRFQQGFLKDDEAEDIDGGAGSENSFEVSLIPDDGEKQPSRPAVSEDGAHQVATKLAEARKAEDPSSPVEQTHPQHLLPTSDEQARLDLDESIALSLSGSQEGDLEEFDTMDASTLKTRSCCQSLDISFIGAAPGTVEWSQRSSYEVSSVRGVPNVGAYSAIIDDDATDSVVVVEDDDRDDVASVTDGRVEIGAENDRLPRSFLGCSALMTSHIEDDGSQVSGDDEVMLAARHVDDGAAGVDLMEDSQRQNTARPHKGDAARDSEMQRYTTVENYADEDRGVEASDRAAGSRVPHESCGDDADMHPGRASGAGTDAVPLSSKALNDLVSALNGIRRDTSRMANMLTPAEPKGNMKCPLDIHGGNTAALRLLASGIRQQSQMVQQVSGSVVAASREGQYPNNVVALGSLSAMLSESQTLLESISLNLPLEQRVSRLDSRLVHSAERSEERPLVTSMFRPSNEGPNCGLMSMNHHEKGQPCCDHFSVVSDAAQSCIPGSHTEACERDVEGAPSRSPPQLLLQAALRDVLESSLLDVETEISEWQELHQHKRVTDLSSSTLDGRPPDHSRRGRKMELSEFNSLAIPFQGQGIGSAVMLRCAQAGDGSVLDSSLSTSDAADANRGDATEVGMVEKTSEKRYENFIDARSEQRVRLAGKLMSTGVVRKGLASMERAGTEMASKSLGEEFRARSADCNEKELLEQYVQLSAEMEACMLQLPVFASAIGASRNVKQIPPSASRNTTLDGCSRPNNIGKDNRASGAHEHGFVNRQRFCSPKDRAAFAERLSKKRSFCSPIDRIALAGRLAKIETSLQASMLHGLAHAQPIPAPMNGVDGKTAHGDAALVVDESASSGGDVALANEISVMTQAHTAVSEIQELDVCFSGGKSSALCAEAQLLHTELQSVASELAVATRDLTDLVAMSSSAPAESSALQGSQAVAREICDISSKLCDCEHHSIVEERATQTATVSVASPRELVGLRPRARRTVTTEIAVEGYVTETPGRDSCEAHGVPGFKQQQQTDECHATFPVSKVALQMCVQHSPPATVQDDSVSNHVCDAGHLSMAKHCDAGHSITYSVSPVCLQQGVPGADACCIRMPTDHRDCESQAVPPERDQDIIPSVGMLESLQDLTKQIRAVADMQASVSHGNQLLLEKTDVLNEGVQRSLGQLSGGQSTIEGAVSALNSHISLMRDSLHDVGLGSTGGGAFPPRASGDGLPTCSAGTQTHTPAHVQTQTEAESTERRFPVEREVAQHPKRSRDFAVQENSEEIAACTGGACFGGASMALPLTDLKELISELQRVTTEMKSSHVGQAQQLQSRGRRPAAVGVMRAGFDDEVAIATTSDTDDGKRASKEMEDVLCMLRERRAISNSSHRGDELDLSSFGPRGPAAEAH